jgi:hypothetical protein
MPVIAIPKDIEFRKVTPTQQKSLEKIMSDSKNNTLRAVAIPTIALSTLAVVGATAFLFKDQIKAFVEENVDDLTGAITEKIKGVVTGAGDIVSDTIVTVVGRDEPQTPEFTPSGAGPIPRCDRWASDYVDTIKDDPSPTEIVLLALAQKNIIKNMKRDKCNRPSIIPQSQWDDV